MVLEIRVPGPGIYVEYIERVPANVEHDRGR